MSNRAFERMEETGTLYMDDSTVWLPTGYEGYYVCKEGFVSHNGRLLKPHKGDNHGHLNVRISTGPPGQKYIKEVYIHRLVKETFEGNPYNMPIVRHLDDDPSNNRLENLAWGTQKDNHDDCVRNGNIHRFSDEDREIHLSEQRTPVVAIRKDDGQTLYFGSQTEAAEKLSIPQGNIWKVLHGERKHAGGYAFCFDEK